MVRTYATLYVRKKSGLTPLEPQSRFGDNPLERSPVLGTNYLKFEWIVPKTGLRF